MSRCQYCGLPLLPGTYHAPGDCEEAAKQITSREVLINALFYLRDQLQIACGTITALKATKGQKDA